MDINSPDLAGTAKIVFEALSEEGIPAVYCGGFAMHYYGGRRPTEDIDLIIPQEYISKLADMLWKTLKPTFPGAKIKFVCKQTGVGVDIIPAGKKMRETHHYSPIVPVTPSIKPVPITIQQLVTMKLDSYHAAPIARVKDMADVVELIQVANLPRTLCLPDIIQQMYTELWDNLQADLENNQESG